MNSLTFDRYTGNVPVIDANTGIILSPSFTPLFRRDSFQLAGLLTSVSGPAGYFFTPSEIIAINTACALIRPDKPHTQGELIYTGREPFATLGEISACSPDGMPLGALDSITVDGASGMPVSFSTGAGRGVSPGYASAGMSPLGMLPINAMPQPWMQQSWSAYSQPAMQQPAVSPWSPQPYRQPAVQPLQQVSWQPRAAQSSVQPSPAPQQTEQQEAPAKAATAPEPADSGN
ncbi:MAG: hypothetical protein HUJ80_09635, partial [Firmicutes bacterium]|nr:hypothetical protein [Bacillota bacterium]